MGEHVKVDTGTLQEIAFVGRTLGPLFRYDPLLDYEKIAPLYATLAASDVQSLADEWPFVPSKDAKDALSCMVREAAAFVDSPQESGGPSDATGELALEYRRLFVGPAKKAAPPWGSVYTDRDQVVFGLSTLELRGWMREHGVSMRKQESEEPEDHIGIMLELMAWIAENRPELLETYLSQHLLTWAPHFLRILRDATSNDFFWGLATITLESLTGMQSVLALEVTEPRFYR